MAALDRQALLDDTKLYLPDGNVLSDLELSRLVDHVVDFQIPADDDQYYSEALCKILRAAALLNRSKVSVDESGLKREKVGGTEFERHNISTVSSWETYLDSLADVCPYLPGGGYTPSKAIGMKINPSEKFVISDCGLDTIYLSSTNGDSS